jgi:hypothetical protein
MKTDADAYCHNFLKHNMNKLNRMAPTQKRKADDGPLSPNTKRARKKVVNELAEKVYAIQLLDSRHECRQMDGYGSKYGSIKRIVADAKKIYTWVDRTKIYNCL